MCICVCVCKAAVRQKMKKLNGKFQALRMNERSTSPLQSPWQVFYWRLLTLFLAHSLTTMFYKRINTDEDCEDKSYSLKIYFYFSCNLMNHIENSGFLCTPSSDSFNI